MGRSLETARAKPPGTPAEAAPSFEHLNALRTAIIRARQDGKPKEVLELCGEVRKLVRQLLPKERRRQSLNTVGLHERWAKERLDSE